MNPVAKRLLSNAARETNPVIRESLTTKARRIMLREELGGCNECPLRALSGIPEPIPFKGPTPALLAIIIDQPTKRDVRPTSRGTAPTPTLCAPRTPAGDLLDRLISGIGLTREHVWIGAANHCPTHDTLGRNLLASNTLAVAGLTKQQLSPQHCVDRYAVRALNLSKAEVVILMGESALLVGKQYKAFSGRATFEACRNAQPLLQAGRYWIVTHGIEHAANHTACMPEVRVAFRVASTMIEERVTQRAMGEFPGSHVMGSRTYEELVGEAMGVIGSHLADLPPARARLAALDTLREIVDHLEASRSHTDRIGARYAIRLLRDLEVGKIVWPSVGHEAKGME